MRWSGGSEHAPCRRTGCRAAGNYIIASDRCTTKRVTYSMIAVFFIFTFFWIESSIHFCELGKAYCSNWFWSSQVFTPHIWLFIPVTIMSINLIPVASVVYQSTGFLVGTNISTLVCLLHPHLGILYILLKYILLFIIICFKATNLIFLSHILSIFLKYKRIWEVYLFRIYWFFCLFVKQRY